MNLGKKTKIVCTIGPASESAEKMEQLAEAGMNVARLNFSHGDFNEHQRRVDNIKKVTVKTGKTIAILQDLCGPKIRIGTFKDGMITLHEGQQFTLTTEEVEGTSDKVHVNYADLPKEVKKGGFIMLQDGTKKLEVVKVDGNDIVTRVVIGGRLSNHKGVNVPGANLSLSSLTDKDRADIEFGVKNKADFVALSFVRKAGDIQELRSILRQKGSNSHIIAKIETPEALADIDGIIEAADGVMVARGDLAIEIPAEEVPLVQKLIIHKCNSAGKPVITATQMMESMVKNQTPTRAEISDVANAIIDGTDAVMLSEETAIGDFPVEAVEVMTRIAQRIEREVYTRDTIAEYDDAHGVTDTVSQAAVRTAHTVGAKLIVALTHSGRTARMIARYRPAEHILAFTDAAENADKLMLSFGCYPMTVPTMKTVDEIMEIVRKTALDRELAGAGDKVVIAAGMPFGTSAETNMVLVETL
ncbi:pyruvate kinase [Patescibacteria group bacterium]|nr:pyruvate kinase [Patescibacteria group bacterium]MDE1946774.1 pyruvate kinase [Patescibacteria group bacterium]MDE2011094.1 pyruvate kinase [Patescibacteria group bacterium]MDE2233600.1 pyruvate kinase [Patescibacteria group bacterium]